MSEIKVRLSLEVPGATMLSSLDCEKMSKKDAFNHESIIIEWTEKHGKKVKKHKEHLHINTRKSRTAKQNISITKESYEYMISKNCPDTKLSRVWGTMGKKARLEYHFKEIAEYFNAISFSYEILDD